MYSQDTVRRIGVAVIAAATMVMLAVFIGVGLQRLSGYAQAAEVQSKANSELISRLRTFEANTKREQVLALCSAELHHHATLEALLTIGRELNVSTTGLHVPVDPTVAETCAAVPGWTKALAFVHSQSAKLAPLSHKDKVLRGELEP